MNDEIVNFACHGVKSVITLDNETAFKIAGGSHLQLWGNDVQSDLWVDHFDVRNQLDISDLKQHDGGSRSTAMFNGHLEYILDDDESSYYEDLVIERFQDLLDSNEEDLNCQVFLTQKIDLDNENTADTSDDNANETLDISVFHVDESTTFGYQSNRAEIWVRPEREPYFLPLPWNIPGDMKLPMSKKQFDVIVHTVKSIRQKGSQFEIFLKLKQSDTNFLFDFLNYECDLFHLFQHMKNLSEESFWTGLESLVPTSLANMSGNEGRVQEPMTTEEDVPTTMNKIDNTELSASVECSEAVAVSSALSLLGNIYGDESSSDDEDTIRSPSTESSSVLVHSEDGHQKLGILIDCGSDQKRQSISQDVVHCEDFDRNEIKIQKHNESIGDSHDDEHQDEDQTRDKDENLCIADDEDSSDETASTASLINGLGNEHFESSDADELMNLEVNSTIAHGIVPLSDVNERVDLGDEHNILNHDLSSESECDNGRTARSCSDLEEGEEREKNDEVICIEECSLVMNSKTDPHLLLKSYLNEQSLDDDEPMVTSIEDVEGRTELKAEGALGLGVQSQGSGLIHRDDEGKERDHSKNDEKNCDRMVTIPDQILNIFVEPSPFAESDKEGSIMQSKLSESDSDTALDARSDCTPLLLIQSNGDDNKVIDSGPIACTHFDSTEDVYTDVISTTLHIVSNLEDDVDDTKALSAELKKSIDTLDAESSKLSNIDDDLLDEDVDEVLFWGTAHLCKRQSNERLKLVAVERKLLLKKMDDLVVEQAAKQKMAVRLRRAKMLKNLFEEKAAAAKLETTDSVPVAPAAASSSTVTDDKYSPERSVGDESSESHSSDSDEAPGSRSRSRKWKVAERDDSQGSRGRKGKRENKYRSTHHRDRHSYDSDSEREKRRKRSHRSRDRSHSRGRMGRSSRSKSSKSRGDDKEKKRAVKKSSDRDRDTIRSFQVKRVATRSRSRSPSRSRSRSITRGDKKSGEENHRYIKKDKHCDREKKKNRIERHDERKVIEKGLISSSLSASVATVSVPFRDKIKLALDNESLDRAIAIQPLPQVAFRDRVQLALDSLK